MSVKSCAGPVSLILLFAALSRFGEAASPVEPASRATLTIWDTGSPSETPLTPANLLKRPGWSPIAPDQKNASFRGDAVVSNGKILAVFRKHGAGIEVYTGGDPALLRFRAVLQATDGNAARLVRLALAENGKGRVCLEASCQTAKGTSIAARFSLKKDDVALETEPGAGAVGLRVECPSRYALLPDFFADDMAIDATKIPLPAIEVPSENFVLQPAPDGEAIVMAVFENRDQDVRLTVSGEKEKRTITGSEIRFGKGRKIWVGLLESPGIWHVAETAGDTGKVSRAGYKIPFRAQWRVDFHRREELIDSWTLLLQEKKDGDYLKPTITGDVHSGFRPQRIPAESVSKGYGYYTAWADSEGDVYLWPPDWPTVLKGPVIIYPLNRVAETPPEVMTVVDFARSCLGSGPCEYVLDVEGHKDQYKGRATCGVRDILGRIYSKGQQKEKHDEVEKCLSDGLTFVTHIRSRITAYLEFLAKVKQYLADQGKAHPDLKSSIAELEKVLREIDARVAERLPKTKPPEEVARMNDDFRKNVLDYEGPDALERCKKYTSALVEIGSNQDELVFECRRIVKTLRQRAGIMMALEPKMIGVAGEIRAQTHEILRNPAWHEAAN